MDIRGELLKNKDEKLRQFSIRLIPEMEPKKIIGVRLPVLRKIAKGIAKGDYNEFFENISDDSFEEIMLQGMVIGYVKEDVHCVIKRINDFLPKVNNWSLCDSFCSGLKIARVNKDIFWDMVCQCMQEDRVYYIRFGAVMALNYFMEEKYIDEFVRLAEAVKNDDYYVKMALAWALSIYFINFEYKMFEYLQDCNLNDWIYNKTIQKICESRVPRDSTKKLLRKMKRINN